MAISPLDITAPLGVTAPEAGGAGQPGPVQTAPGGSFQALPADPTQPKYNPTVRYDRTQEASPGPAVEGGTIPAAGSSMPPPGAGAPAYDQHALDSIQNTLSTFHDLALGKFGQGDYAGAKAAADIANGLHNQLISSQQLKATESVLDLTRGAGRGQLPPGMAVHLPSIGKGFPAVSMTGQRLPAGAQSSFVSSRTQEYLQQGLPRAQAETRANQDWTKEVVAGRAEAQAGGAVTGRLGAESANFGVMQALKGQRVFDTQLGRDVTNEIGDGSMVWDSSKHVTVPPADARNMQLGLARRTSYNKVADEIDQFLGTADEYSKRAGLTTDEYAKWLTGQSTLWKKIALMNSHAINSMRFLSGAAPRSEKMLKLEQDAFANIRPGTAREVLAVARDGYNTQVDETLAGLAYRQQATPEVKEKFDITKPRTTPSKPPSGPAPAGATHWSPTKGYLDSQGNPVGATNATAR